MVQPTHQNAEISRRANTTPVHIVSYLSQFVITGGKAPSDVEWKSRDLRQGLARLEVLDPLVREKWVRKLSHINVGKQKRQINLATT